MAIYGLISLALTSERAGKGYLEQAMERGKTE